MKHQAKHIVLILSFLFSLSLGAIGIEFKELSLDNAITLAEQENKAIFVDFYTNWCAPCKKLASTVFTDERLGGLFTANFISIRIDGDAKEAMFLKEKFNITAYPTMHFLDKNGEAHRKLIGYRTANELMNSTNSLITNAPLANYRSSFKNGNRTPSFVCSYLQELKFNHLPTELIAKTYLNSTSINLKSKFDLQIIIEAKIHYESEISLNLFKNVDVYYLENEDLVAELIQQIILNKYKEAFENRNSDMLAYFLPKVIDAFRKTIDNEVSMDNFTDKLNELFRIEIRGLRYKSSKTTV